MDWVTRFLGAPLKISYALDDLDGGSTNKSLERPVYPVGVVAVSTPRMRMTDESSSSFWKSLPGALTALAAVITAIGGTIAILLQVGLIGGTDKTPEQPTVTSNSVVAGATSTPTPAGTATAAVGGKAWSEVEAVITTTDGRETRMRAELLRYCFSGGAGMYVNENQNIAFEKMKRIDVLRSDVALSVGGRATIRMEFVDDTSMEATISSGCQFMGESSLGRFESYSDRLKSIEFKR